MSTQRAIDANQIDVALVQALVGEQFPQWSALPVRPVERGGNDHRMFRLGDELLVRLPAAPGYVPQVEKEQRWLPRLASSVPLRIPEVCGAGKTSELFGAPWSVYGWLDGQPASVSPIDDPVRLAGDVAEFLVALRQAPVTTDAPAPGLHSAFRGGPLKHWDDEMGDIIHRVHGRERDVAAGIWRDALDAEFTGPPVWFHGDVSVNNLLLTEGRLSAVIDFGCSATGDPACDTVMLWTLFTGRAREQFRRTLDVDKATWARGRGWALWKSLIMITNKPPGQAEFARRVLNELIAGV
ncbi:aminoglycoside phosphotransferase family protein [Microbacterium sp. HD4P20]|uniref:aminoglycoside phosphotransferase family protein n=1 Tax=Microbacterium sp. HD4P20 TaxID=2864874 RepID=UPI001C640E4E|nr:aminoglycoside phosphotransferase family protein [Microbacterium sp. HD4P20]MCP2636597.1 aminoglycoside phosphotransferase family protein [Microbacterium sp. HD4P20]